MIMNKLLLKLLKYFLFSLFIALSLSANANESETAIRFDAKTLRKKGIHLSELSFPIAQGKKDTRIKYSSAMRFDATYQPTDGGKPVDLPIDEIKRQTERAHAVVKQVKESKRFTSLLEGKNIELPIGIKRIVGNKEIIICLDSIVFTPTHAYGVLYTIIEDTKNNSTLAFYAKDVRFTKDGGFTGDARLELLKTYDLKFGNNTTISFLVDKMHENYVVFNCDGFKHLHVDARIFFSRNTFLPEDFTGKVLPKGQVTAEFQTDMESLDEFMVSISHVPRFQVVGLEGFSFEITGVTFDYSSTQSPMGITFPANYNSTAFVGLDHDPWEGFYISSLTITLPENFKLKTSTERISLTVKNGIIDKLGFTGEVIGRGLIPLNKGDLGGWAYSLDELSISLVKNTPVGAGFKGNLVIPVTKETEVFTYSAVIQPSNYDFTLNPRNNLSFPMWGAGNVEIYQDSKINVGVVNKKFVPKASLTGKLSITATLNGKTGDNNTNDKNSNLNLAELSFQKVIIQTTSPYISLDPIAGGVSFGSPKVEQKLAKLPISISNVGMVNAGPNLVGIKLKVSINLLGEKEAGGGFSGTADVVVYGQNTSGTKYSYHKTELTKVTLKQAEIACVKLGGEIEFYRDDETYGSGFSGAINMVIDLQPSKIDVKSKCIFGKVPLPNNQQDIYRYFAVDALVGFSPAIAMFPGIVKLNAFGGGMSNRMRMDNNVQKAKFVSNSGVSYVPDNTKGVGLKALLGIQGETKQMYEGQIIFELEFNPKGGVSQIAFSGYVQVASLGNTDQFQQLKSSMGGFVSKVKSVGGKSIMDAGSAKPSEVYGEIQRMGTGGALLAQWRMLYDRGAKCFTANIDMFVDVAKVMKGRKAHAHAGRIDIYFKDNGHVTDWHIFVGRPDDILELSVVDFVNIGGYFMMGKNLPTPRAMPNGKRAGFPNVPVDGMGLGARLHIGAEGGGSFWYKAGVDVGFDFLLWNVAGQNCNGKQKGVKGWYGAGQAYLYGYASAGFKKCVTFGWPCHCGFKCCCKWGKCFCFCCSDWCTSKECVDFSGGLTIDISAQLEAANPTYVEASVGILGIYIPVKAGKRC